MTTEIVRPNSALQVLDEQFIQRRSDFEAVLGKSCPFDRFVRIVKTAVAQNVDLLQVAARPSLFNSCFKCAADGLIPDGREAALVIFNTKKQGVWTPNVQYMPMIGGILKKIRNSGQLLSITSHMVYEHDEFSYELGDNESIMHKPDIHQARGEAIAVYAIAKLKNGGIYRELMTIDEIESIRALSKNKDSIWTAHYGEMCKKTVLRRLAKRLPISTDIVDIMERDTEGIDEEINAPVRNEMDVINDKIKEPHTIESKVVSGAGSILVDHFVGFNEEIVNPEGYELTEEQADEAEQKEKRIIFARGDGTIVDANGQEIPKQKAKMWIEEAETYPIDEEEEVIAPLITKEQQDKLMVIIRDSKGLFEKNFPNSQELMGKLLTGKLTRADYNHVAANLTNAKRQK